MRILNVNGYARTDFTEDECMPDSHPGRPIFIKLTDACRQAQQQGEAPASADDAAVNPEGWAPKPPAVGPAHEEAKDEGQEEARFNCRPLLAGLDGFKNVDRDVLTDVCGHRVLENQYRPIVIAAIYEWTRSP